MPKTEWKSQRGKTLWEHQTRFQAYADWVLCVAEAERSLEVIRRIETQLENVPDEERWYKHTTKSALWSYVISRYNVPFSKNKIEQDNEILLQLHARDLKCEPNFDADIHHDLLLLRNKMTAHSDLIFHGAETSPITFRLRDEKDHSQSREAIYGMGYKALRINEIQIPSKILSAHISAVKQYCQNAGQRELELLCNNTLESDYKDRDIYFSTDETRVEGPARMKISHSEIAKGFFADQSFAPEPAFRKLAVSGTPHSIVFWDSGAKDRVQNLINEMPRTNTSKIKGS